eukprot:5549207-Amphidinium_carterae.4
MGVLKGKLRRFLRFRILLLLSCSVCSAASKRFYLLPLDDDVCQVGSTECSIAHQLLADS